MDTEIDSRYGKRFNNPNKCQLNIFSKEGFF